MATFGESFELCKISNGAELIGAEKHSEDDYFILTFKNKEVLVYNVSFVPFCTGNSRIVFCFSKRQKSIKPLINLGTSHCSLDNTWCFQMFICAVAILIGLYISYTVV
jgi:hypothetical protein